MGFRYRWFDEKINKQDEMGLPLTRAEIDARERKRAPKPFYSRGEKSGILIAAVGLGYGIINKDWALTFFCLAFLLFEGKKPLANKGSSTGKNIANLMQGFSIALLFGAFLLAFGF